MTKRKLYSTLFQEYVSVCNKALQANKDCFPYDRILHQIEFLLKCHVVQAAVYDEDENHPSEFYDMVFENGLMTLKVAHKPHAKHPWLLKKSFLEEVTQHPGEFINNPATLNWKWLTDHCVGV